MTIHTVDPAYRQELFIDTGYTYLEQVNNISQQLVARHIDKQVAS